MAATRGTLAEHNVSFVPSSAVIADDRGQVSGITVIVTNHAPKEQGFVISRCRVGEVLKPGNTKVGVSQRPIGTEQSVFPHSNQLDKAHTGGLLYIKR